MIDRCGCPDGDLPQRHRPGYAGGLRGGCIVGDGVRRSLEDGSLHVPFGAKATIRTSGGKMEPKEFNANLLCRVAGHLHALKEFRSHGHLPTEANMDLLAAVGAHALRLAETLDLRATIKQGQRVRERVEAGRISTMNELVDLYVHMYDRLVDEIGDAVVLLVPDAQAGGLKEPFLSATTIARFPSIEHDAREASRCFALGRNTAAVFHMMRMLEVPLRALSQFVNIEKHSPTWNAYLGQLSPAARKRFPAPGGTDKEMRDYVSELEGHLRAIKDAWRNPTMHNVARTYTDEDARELCVLINGFMRRAAVHLDELLASLDSKRGDATVTGLPENSTEP